MNDDFVNPWSGSRHYSPRPTHKVYKDRRWEPLRKSVLDKQPLCVHCLKEGRTTLATDIDHILPIREAPGLAFTLSNLQPLCSKCHGIKTAKETK